MRGPGLNLKKLKYSIINAKDIIKKNDLKKIYLTIETEN